MTKVILRFRERFWERSGVTTRHAGRPPPPFGFLHSRDEYFPTWWTSLPALAPILTVWAGGPAAERSAMRGEEFVIERALDSLCRILGLGRERLADLLVAWYAHDWRADSYARGAYSYIPVGGLDAPRMLAEPIENTLFFAGEATDLDGENRTIHCAMASGRRTAVEIFRGAIHHAHARTERS